MQTFEKEGAKFRKFLSNAKVKKTQIQSNLSYGATQGKDKKKLLKIVTP